MVGTSKIGIRAKVLALSLDGHVSGSQRKSFGKDFFSNWTKLKFRSHFSTLSLNSTLYVVMESKARSELLLRRTKIWISENSRVPREQLYYVRKHKRCSKRRAKENFEVLEEIYTVDLGRNLTIISSQE
jgi:hypothetical protein